jgi:hypothetical protein
MKFSKKLFIIFIIPLFFLLSISITKVYADDGTSPTSAPLVPAPAGNNPQPPAVTPSPPANGSVPGSENSETKIDPTMLQQINELKQNPPAPLPEVKEPVTATTKTNNTKTTKTTFTSSVKTPSDIKNTKYETAVRLLIKNKIISCYSDNTFKPNKLITRAEFAKIICLASGTTVDSKNVKLGKFSDVTKANWAHAYIMAAEKNNLMKGYSYPQAAFKPNNKITYAEVVTILVRMFTSKVPAGEWPQNYINEGRSLGIIKSFYISKPSANATRGDVAILTWSAFWLKNK